MAMKVLLAFSALVAVAAGIKCYECSASSTCGTGECQGDFCYKAGMALAGQTLFSWGCFGGPPPALNASGQLPPMQEPPAGFTPNMTMGCKESMGFSACACDDRDFCNGALPAAVSFQLTAFLAFVALLTVIFS